MVGNHLPEEWEVDNDDRDQKSEVEVNGKPALKSFVSSDLSTLSNDTHITSVDEHI